MKLINAKIPADLSVCAIEDGLKELESENLQKVYLLVSDKYNFGYIYSLFYDNNVKIIEIPLSNVDTTQVLETDSWLLIDNENKKIYYSPGV